MLELYLILGLPHCHEVPDNIKNMSIKPFTKEQIIIHETIELFAQVVDYFAEVPVEQTLL